VIANNHSFVNIIACDDRDGLWCCAYDGPCCNNTWHDPPLGQLLLSEVLIISTVSGSGMAATVACSATAYATVTAYASTSNSSSVAVGVEIGVPLGIIALVTASYAIWLHRRRSPAHVIDAEGQVQMSVYRELQGETFETGSIKVAPRYNTPPVHELGMQEVHEAPGANRGR
jgi:hypothetical protein